MRFASSATSQAVAADAVRELLAPIDRRVTPGMVDLVMLFCTLHYDSDVEFILRSLQEAFPQAIIMGCSACGTIGEEREIETGPGMAMIACSMPDVVLYPFHLKQDDLAASRTHLDWERRVGVSPESCKAFLAWADPFRMQVMAFVDQINQFYPRAPLIGGVASGGRRQDQNVLFYAGEVVREGVVGVALTGEVDVGTVVSQGCRPIGKPFVVTKGMKNIISELGGHAPLSQLDAVLKQLPPEDFELAKQFLLLGRVIDEHKSDFGRGDFLIHSITGADRETGALAIAGPVRVGSTVQFHIRDAATADEDLRLALAPHIGTDVAGALLCSCNGRGTQMWASPNHDIGTLHDMLGDVPAAGLFCAGEFGPVAFRNFIHGFTASIALFRPTGGAAE
jgi:small ligand-binding sensory domain FIST